MNIDPERPIVPTARTRDVVKSQDLKLCQNDSRIKNSLLTLSMGIFVAENLY